MLKDKKYKLVIIALIIETIVLISVSSFAYFTATVSSNSQVNTVTTGKMSIVYEEGMQIKLDNAVPGDTATKTFTITNTGTVDTTYDIYITSVANDLLDLSNVTYSLKSTTGGYNTTNAQPFPNADCKIAAKVAIAAGETQNYTLTITFVNKETSQDVDQGKNISAKIEISGDVNSDLMNGSTNNSKKATLSYVPGTGNGANTPNADNTNSQDFAISDSSTTNLNLNIDQSVTIPSGYYAYPITVNNAVINKGPLYLNSTNTYDPGYYNGVITNPNEYKQTIYAGFYNAQTKNYSSFPGFEISGLDTGSKTISYTFPLYNIYDDNKTPAILNSITWYQMAGGNRGYGNITGTIKDNKGKLIYTTNSTDTTAYVNLLTIGTVDETASSLTLTIYGYYDGTAGYAGGWAKCNSISIGYIIP